MNLPSQLKDLYRWLIGTEGATHSFALIRLGVVANCWARWSNDHVLYRDLRPETLLVATLFFLSSTTAFLGLWTRVSTAVLALCTCHFVFIAGHIHGHEPYTHHHTTLLAYACIFLALSPSGRSLSVDRWLLLRKKEKNPAFVLPPETANLWSLRLMAIQVAAIYYWGGVDKLNHAFLNGDRMIHYLMYYYTGPAEIDWFGFESLARLSARATVALEFALAVGLFFPKGRRYLLIPGLLLHGIFYFSLSVFTFTTTMWTLYIAYLDPDEVRRVLKRLVS